MVLHRDDDPLGSSYKVLSPPHLLYILYHIFCIDANRRIIFLLNFLLSGAWCENFARAPEFRAFARGCLVAEFYVFKKIK